MATPPALGDLAFVGPSHVEGLADFQYVALVAIEANMAIVKVVGPDAEDEASRLSIPLDMFGYRTVQNLERELWPGSFVAHPVAFIRTSAAGPDEWAYGVVSGYTASESVTTLHLGCQDTTTRLPLLPETPVIKVDALNYAIQTGGGANPIALSATELLAAQNNVVVLFRRRRSGLPDTITRSLTIPFNGSDVVPLIRPTTLQLVRVRRQHIVDFHVAARTKRPDNMYVDNHAQDISTTTASEDNPPRLGRRRTRPDDDDESDPDDSSEHDHEPVLADISSDDEDVDIVRQMHRPLSKRRRISRRRDSSSDFGSSASEDEHSKRRDRGVVFHPSPTERRVHKAIVRRRHKGKLPQFLLQTAQQSSSVDFIGTPPILRGAWHFAFGAGLSIMHFRRALPTDEVAVIENGVNMWDFSSKNNLSPPPKAASCSDLIGALSAFYKFGKFLYNKATTRFIAAARNFIIGYADNAPQTVVMARLLTHWINCKFSRFRSLLVTKGLESALHVRKEFTRNDEKLIALKESIPSWQQQTVGSYPRGTESTGGKPQRQPDQRRPKIPSSVIASLPKGDDGRRLCLRYVSKAGCTLADCARAHFRPESLTTDAKNVIIQRWKGLADECKDL
ncbi:uncharacterized protein KRP23_98 [Phytophthora ramorum]|uniref:uncharacterized protein n=1 Tax=Phytophthora ramorum TaxID=164328 RepID=UPI00309CFFB4|nr:hypothetical protein KRP23_98 [Phytophthora ramorum]